MPTELRRRARAALDAVPVAVVLVDGQARAVWANRAAVALSSSDPSPDSSRLFTAVAQSDPVRRGLATREETQGPVRLPTDLGLVDRIVTVAPLADDPDLVVVSFVAPGIAATPGEDEMRKRLETMLEHTSEMITVLAPDGTIRFSNAAAGRLTGLTGAAVNGRFAFELIHPDDLGRVTGAFLEAVATPGPSPRVGLRIKFADGRWHDVEASVNNLIGVEGIDGLVVSMYDVTDRRAAEQRREALLANLSDVVVVIDDQFEITYTSDSISRVIDAPPETNLGMSAFNDIHPDDLPVAIDALGSVAKQPIGATVRVEVRLESRPGSGLWRWMEATAVNLLEDPAVAGIVITLHDVTDQKRAAQHLQDAYEKERANAARLAELDRLKDEFLATVSHELRTPLAAIVGFADLIRRGTLDPAMHDQLVGRISASAAEMRSMIDNVLDFSALEAARVALDMRTVAIAEVTETCLASVAHQLDDHVVDVHVDGAVWADEHGLGHVLRNLITNAAKYSDEGTRITIRSRTVNVEGGTPDEAVRSIAIDVVDEGIGIPMHDLERVFDRFYRSPSASFAARGSGIGLNIAKRYTELMGGTIKVTSSLGAGSTFTVTLPAAP